MAESNRHTPFRLLIGGAIGVALALPFTFGILGGWLGLNLMQLPVVNHPRGEDFILFALGPALAAGLLAAFIGALLVWPQSKKELAGALGLVVLILAGATLLVLSPYAPGTISELPRHVAIMHIAALFLLTMLTPILRPLAHFAEKRFQRSRPTGIGILAGMVVVVMLLGFGMTTWAGRPTDPGGYDATCLQSVWAVDAHADTQGWNNYTLDMINCEGTLQGEGQAEIIVQQASGKQYTCTTSHWATEIECVP
jgi:hypothetical protein